MTEFLISEQCGSKGKHVNYSKTDSDKLIKSKESNRITTNLVQSITSFFRDILLPYGYPDSVSGDYFDYQLWDSVQAFCSTITSIFTTQAILKGVGVGNAEATALSATITWIMKDGTGMVGRIIFAWWKGNGLDSDCKKWRLFADFLNDLAMIFELCIPFVSTFSTHILCLSTSMKAVVGVAGGATRASIIHHQAIKGNMAEISAKDGSQETVVNLIASCSAIFLLGLITEPLTEWMFILLLIIIHLYANYRAVTSLVFKTMNNTRLAILLKSYLVINTALNPIRINQKESVLLGFGLRVQEFCGFKIEMGKSINNIYKLYSADDMQKIVNSYKTKHYFLVPDLGKRIIYVFFERGERADDVIAAYYNAVLLAIATCFYNHISLDIYSKRQLHHTTPITRLTTFMKSYEHSSDHPINIPIDLLAAFNEFVEQESKMLFTALLINGWKTSTHSLKLDQWRIQTNKKLL